MTEPFICTVLAWVRPGPRRKRGPPHVLQAESVVSCRGAVVPLRDVLSIENTFYSMAPATRGGDAEIPQQQDAGYFPGLLPFADLALGARPRSRESNYEDHSMVGGRAQRQRRSRPCLYRRLFQTADFLGLTLAVSDALICSPVRSRDCIPPTLS